jgi:biotin transport system substrate-specific component
MHPIQSKKELGAMKRIALKGMIMAAVFAALTGILTQVQIPLEPVPINMALFSVYMAGALMGPWYGALSMAAYVLLGAVGVPVFSGFSGGLHKLVGPTGGYIVGYVLCAFLTGGLSRAPLFKASLSKLKGWRGFEYAVLALSMLAGLVGCYALGTAWFMLTTGRDLWTSLGLCVLPFLPGDAVKIALATILSGRLRAPLRASGWSK